jgi:hypothetical protein
VLVRLPAHGFGPISLRAGKRPGNLADEAEDQLVLVCSFGKVLARHGVVGFLERDVND